MWTLLISCIIHSFFNIVQKNQKPVFKIRESLPFLSINLNWCAKFQIYRFLIRDSDWLNFIHFSGYKYKISLKIKKKRWSDINLDIHHSKVPSSDYSIQQLIIFEHIYEHWFKETLSVILSKFPSPFKVGNAWFTAVPLKP